MQKNQIKQLINTPAFVVTIIQCIESILARELSDHEETNVISFIKNVAPLFFGGVKRINIIRVISETAIGELHLNTCGENIIDIHEMLRGNLGETTAAGPSLEEKAKIAAATVKVNIGSIFGLDDMASVVKKMNEPINSINNAYFMLDSRYRILGNDGTTFFQWGHINNIILAQGTFNSVGDIKDIISIKIMPFRLPNVTGVITAYNRISTLIYELCPQSYIAHEERCFHFLGVPSISVDTNWVNVNSEDFSDGEFKFNKPITHLDSMTVTFASPLEPIVLDKDRLMGTVTSFAAATEITFTENHKLATGDIVYATTFNTINPTNDQATILSVNGKSGNVATVTSTTQINIPVDTSMLLVALTGTVDAPAVALAGTVATTYNSNIIVGTGTAFSTDFNVTDSIIIDDVVFGISAITNALRMELTSLWPKTDATNTYMRTSSDLTGTNTLFSTEVVVGDVIRIYDGNTNPTFKINAVLSNTSLTLSRAYDGDVGLALNAEKDNTLNLSYSIFFGSKRVFLPLEITYLSPSTTM
jgi:hypothetical protein